MQETIQTVFLGGRERYARLRQIASLVFAGTLFVHLTLFLGYTRATRDAENARAELAVATSEFARCAAVRDSLAPLEPSKLDAALTQIGKDLVEDLREDFRELETLVRAAKEDGATEPSPRADVEPLQDANAAVFQGTPRSRRTLSPIEARFDDAPLVTAVRAADDSRSLRVALSDVVREDIVSRRFREANEAWRAYLGRQVVDPAAASIKLMEMATRGDRGSDPRWKALLDALSDTVGQAQALTIRAPDGDDWWRSVAAKAESVGSVIRSASDSLATEATKAITLSHALSTAAAEALASSRALTDAAEARHDAAKAQSEKLIASLASFAKPLDFIAVDPESLVRWFPLAVGIALAFAAYLGTEALRARRDAIDFATAADPKDEAWARVVAQERAAIAPRRGGWLVWLGAAAVWTGLAAWRLVSLGTTTPPHAVTVALAGCAVVGAALVHRAWSERTPAQA